MATGKNAKPALDDALKNAINALFQRDDLYQALARANAAPYFAVISRLNDLVDIALNSISNGYRSLLMEKA